jgi:hypothetical protein
MTEETFWKLVINIYSSSFISPPQILNCNLKSERYLVYIRTIQYCNMMPESRNSGARVDIHCYKQQLGKHVPVATNTQATMKGWLGNGVFC